jgi:putative transposase
VRIFKADGRTCLRDSVGAHRKVERQDMKMKNSTNPMIILENREWRGRARVLEGEKLLDVLGGLKRKIIDVEIEVPVTRRVYRERRHRDAAQFRLVGIWNDEAGAYHLYITNVPPDRLDPEDIARIYAARWEVELLFKELKSHYRLDELPSGQRYVVDALIYTAVLTLIVSRAMLFAMRRRAKISLLRAPERRWAAAFQTVAIWILRLLCSGYSERDGWRSIEGFLLHEFRDPNVSRARNLNLSVLK